jgi:excisionase family DNA binding protein
MHETLHERELLGAEEVARYLGVKPTTVYQWCREGRLPALKLGKSWRIRRAALEAFLVQSEHRTGLTAQLRTFLQIPDQVLGVCETRDIMHRLDTAFFKVAEARGGSMVKFIGGEAEELLARLRADFTRSGLDVMRLEREGRFRFVPEVEEVDPVAERDRALRRLSAAEAARGQTLWVSFDWTQRIGLELAIQQQEALKAVVHAGQLVVKTAVLAPIADDWPVAVRRRLLAAHFGLIELGAASLTLSRRTPLPTEAGM